jgi:hypothetical protein
MRCPTSNRSSGDMGDLVEQARQRHVPCSPWAHAGSVPAGSGHLDLLAILDDRIESEEFRWACSGFLHCM